jgi:hypothetical protein
MMLIGDISDPSGNGMFSRSARQFNKFFINLNKPSTLAPKLFLNQQQFSREDFDAITSKKRLTSPNRFNDTESKFVVRKKQRAKVQPFQLTQGREYFQRMQEKFREGPTYGNYNPKLIELNVKGIKNYNLERCKSKDNLLTNKENIQKTNSKSGISCPRLIKREEKMSLQNNSQTHLFKITGFVEFDKKTGHQPIITKRSISEFDINPDVSYQKTQVSVANSHYDFRKTLPRDLHAEKRRFQRNNYALQVKRDLVEKKTVMMLPDFGKMLERRSQSSNSTCLNPGFYDGEKFKLSTKTLSFAKMLPRTNCFTNY